jgi:hypothetical protein
VEGTFAVAFEREWHRREGEVRLLVIVFVFAL